MRSATFVLLSLILFSSCIKIGSGGPGSAGYIDTIGMENTLTTVAGGIPGFTNAPDTLATFNTPYGLAIDDSGNIYVADELNNCIRKIDTTTHYVSTYAGNGFTGLLNGIALASEFDLPVDAAIDKHG